VEKYGEQWEEQSKFNQYMTTWTQCKSVETKHKPLAEDAKSRLDAAKCDLEAITNDLKSMADRKRALNL
jgi:hypothetical protein